MVKFFKNKQINRYFFHNMAFDAFTKKWLKINEGRSDDGLDEKSLFVDVGSIPKTQRQLNLYNYFIFIQGCLNEINARDVLEVGCGRGTMSLYLAKYIGLKPKLLDNSENAIEIAKKEFAKHNVGAEYYIADALSSGLDGESVDAVYSIGLAEHLDDVEQLFKEQYRLLKHGGMMISLNIPKKFSIQFLNTIMRFFKKIFGKYKESVRKDYYRNKLKPRDYASIAKKAGFSNIKIMHVCPFPVYTPIKMSTDKFVTRINKVILAMKSVFQKYPYKTNKLFAQAHFLVGYKKQ